MEQRGDENNAKARANMKAAIRHAENRRRTCSFDKNVPQKGIPQIEGFWQEGIDKNVTITQNGERFAARCVYKRGTLNIRWNMNGTMFPDGTFKGVLVHHSYPAGWSRTQTRSGKIEASGDVINGRAEWEGGGGHDFQWVRKKSIG